jgi:hypothetical protein
MVNSDGGVLKVRSVGREDKFHQKHCLNLVKVGHDGACGHSVEGVVELCLLQVKSPALVFLRGGWWLRCRPLWRHYFELEAIARDSSTIKDDTRRSNSWAIDVCGGIDLGLSAMSSLYGQRLRTGTPWVVTLSS